MVTLNLEKVKNVKISSKYPVKNSASKGAFWLYMAYPKYHKMVATWEPQPTTRLPTLQLHVCPIMASSSLFVVSTRM